MVHLDGDVPPPRPGDRNRVAGNGTRHGECLRRGSWVQRVSNSDSDVMQSRCSGPRMLDSHRHWWIWTHQFFTKYGLPALRQHTHTHPFNDPFSGTIRVSRYQKGKTNLDFTEARDSEWQWHQLGHMHVCTSLQTDNHASTPPLSFLQAGCPSCRPTASALRQNSRNVHCPFF